METIGGLQPWNIYCLDLNRKKFADPWSLPYTLKLPFKIYIILVNADYTVKDGNKIFYEHT